MTTTLEKYRASLDRFIENEERVQDFTNDNAEGFYTTNTPSPRRVETLPRFMSRLKNRYLSVTFVGDWEAQTQYNVNDVIRDTDNLFWLVTTPHISSDNLENDAGARKLIPYGVPVGPYEYNVRWPWSAEYSLVSGEILQLPKPYYPGTDSLLLFYKGAACSPSNEDSLSTLHQYEEVEVAPGVESKQVRLLFDVQVGDAFDMVVLASAFSHSVAEIKALVEEAVDSIEEVVENATAAATAASAASNSADRAELAAEKAEAVVNLQARRKFEVLTESLSANTEYAVPSFVVGSNKLSVFMNGLRCNVGTTEEYQYAEVGTTGTSSIRITFFDNLPAGTELTALVYA